MVMTEGKDGERYEGFTNEAIEAAKVLLDAGYLTTKGALLVILIGLERQGIEGFFPEEMRRELGVSRGAFYRAKREIEEDMGWTLRRQRGVRLHTREDKED